MRRTIARAMVGLAAAVLGPCAALGQPANDACASAIPLPLGAVTVLNNALATTDPIPSACSLDGRDAWYTIAAPGDGVIAIDTCASSPLDTVVTVYSTSPCAGLGVPVACSDDSCGVQTNLNFDVVAGATYWVRVGSYGSSSGGTIRIGAYFSESTRGQWTYQGRLMNGTTPVEGTVVLELSVYAALEGGSPLFSQLTGWLTAINGLVSTPVYGPYGFDYSNKWLEVRVIDPDTLATIAVLSPRQPMTGSPLALSVGPDAVGAKGLVSDTESLEKVSGGVMRIVSSTVRSTGEVTAPSYKYSVPVTSYANVGPSEFRSRDGEAVRFGLGQGGAWAPTAASSTQLIATAHLPQGATITNVKFFVVDNVSGVNLDLAVERLDYTAGTTAVVGTVTSTGSASGVRSFSIPLSATVNNASDVWTVRVSPTTTWPGSSLLSVVGVQITYTAPKVLP